jgi:type IV pilus assembly protein PilQ
MKTLTTLILILTSATVFAQQTATNQSVTVSAPETGQRLPTLMIEEFTVNKDTRIGTVLRSLGRLAEVNIAFGQGVENLGPFRFNLNNPTPWNEVFESILNVYHLSYEVRGDIITVMTLSDVNQMFAIAKQKKDKLELELHQKSLDPLALEVVQIKYTKAELLAETLSSILRQSAAESAEKTVRGSVSADTANNSIIIHAPKSEMEQMVALIAVMDRQTRQVRIEATLVEVSSKFAFELGIKWSFHANDALRAPGETRSPVEVRPMQMDQSGAFTLSDATYSAMQGIVDSASGDVDYGIIGRDFALGMNLKALEQEGKVKILSRPSLTTMDNQKAMIKSGSDIPFRTEDENGRPVVEYKEAVLSLNVLPHIVDDEAIFMDVNITKDEPDFTQVVDGNPLVTKKEVQTRMMVLDGQTAVIGGLTKNSNQNAIGGIPLLKDIPFIGRLFQSKLKKSDDEELMIFLTPRIVPQSALDNSQIVTEWMDRNYHEKRPPNAPPAHLAISEIDHPSDKKPLPATN